MLADLDRPDLAIAAATATLTKGEDAATLLVLGSVLAEGGGVGDREPLDANRTETLRRAEIFLGRAVVADPHLVDARVVLGLVQARQGRLDEARATWQRGLDVAPNHPELRDLLK
jgi:Flp pilus assembly protein TadD